MVPIPAASIYYIRLEDSTIIGTPLSADDQALADQLTGAEEITGDTATQADEGQAP